MQHAKRLVIVAGEESGDLHAASLVRQLKATHKHLDIAGIGGKYMQNAGVNLLHDLASVSVTGTSEIIRHLRTFIRAFNDIKAYLKTNKPDLLILVDYPEFNLRLAKFAKRKLGLRIVYYISPQVWAWKAGRIKLIRECIDRMAVILPFEKKIYEEAGVPVSFVGHPLVEKVRPCKDINAGRAALQLPQDARLMALLPGSRMNELERHMPTLVATAQLLYKQFNDLHFVIPVASTINLATVKAHFQHASLPYTLISGKAIETVACSDYVIVASGTASLECALLQKPMCIIYKTSLLTYLAASMVIKVKYLGLCNLLQNQMVVPELLQYDCNPTELSRAMASLINEPDTAKRMQNRLQKISQSLSKEQADSTLYALIEKEMGL